MSLSKIITILRAGQFYYQAAHNTVTGKEFFADHGFLGEAYDAYASAYDDVVERAIGLGEELDVLKINGEAARISSGLSIKSCEEILEQALEIEKSLIKAIETVGQVSKGTDNLIAGIADDAEKRIYKIQQRSKE